VSGDLYSYLDSAPERIGSSLMLKAPGPWPAGRTLTYDVLYTTGGAPPNRPASDYRKVVAFLGLKGSFPSLQSVAGGTLSPAPVIATIDTTPTAVVTFATRRDSDDGICLPVRLKGLNPNWQAIYTRNDSKRWRYFGQLDGYRYFSLNTSQSAYTVKAGHPLLADQDEIRIALDDPRGAQSEFEVYNPTAAAMNVTIRTNPAFFKAQSFNLTVAPFNSERLRVSQ
jgi:hypothetical protein